MYGAPLSSCARDPLAGEGCCTWEEPLASRNRVLEVVKELEMSFPQFEQRHVSGRAHVKRAAVAEHGENARGIEGRARDRFINLHAVAKQLRHAIGKVDH